MITIGNDYLKIADGPSVTKAGIDAAGTKLAMLEWRFKDRKMQ
ncbi:MAG: hypothetical protein ACLR5Y_04680 [Haemophilus parainfluenzae]